MDADDGFVEFVSARWTRLYRTACLLTANAAAAEDLVQNALERTYARWPRVSRMEAPEAYVRKQMVNEVISSRRRPDRRREWQPGVRPDVRPDLPSPPGDSGAANHVVMWALVCALPERQRAVVVLRYYEDLTEAETAVVLGCAVGAVKSQSDAAMRALHRGLDAAYLGEVLER
jgi:RNA polymerase sigma-70 factor (sigma-E family)